MKRIVALCVATLLFCIGASAQRKMDNLGRGLVAVPLAENGNGIGTLISWRRLGTEYYDVTYNLYYNGSLLAQGLTNTNYIHTHSITGNETYQVAAVACGETKEKCASVMVWPGWQMYRNGDRYVGGYKDITLGEVYSRGGVNVTNDYSPNDIEIADLDGDGELEFIIKRMNMEDANNLYNNMTDPAYDIIEAYEFDGTRLWWIDVGANMVSANSTETNIIAFDWDQDGAAEVVLRGADDMVIHYMENGVERTQNIGTYGLSYRNDIYHAANGTFTNTGNEYLIYLNGATGKPYNIGNNNEPWMIYPLPRLEQGETDVADAWWYSAQYTGTGKPGILGHRDSKYFMGAPFLDGRKPALFLGRGIYTRHKMIALNLDPGSHKWYTRWTWNCNNPNSPWFGNGYHNFLIADVDEDGRDEIVYGSMVIDDNGMGLSTTGFQHGDAQHVGDFNPYRKGLEFYGCLEDAPYYGSNYRDATTSEILYKFTATGDDGRCLMDNFSNTYPGCLGRSASGGSTEFSSITGQIINGLSETLDAGRLNFRIYWDGDLLSEWQDSPGQTNDKISINKPGLGRIFNADGTAANNDTKHNTCFQGDIIGDWREEFIARVDSRTIRLYTSGVYSDFSLPSLWYDHQYRQAMVTQEMVYNLPPHLSFFLGELEGYTVAPPPQMTNERTEIENGGSITSAHNGKQVIACETNDMTINVTDGVSPWVFTDNAPSKVEGTDYNGTSGTKVRTDGSIGVANPPAIIRTYYTHTVIGGSFTGAMHLTKQGDGTLILPNVTETYTGETTVWAGTLEFNGTMQNSMVAMKRFTTLNTSGGSFANGITMQYGATLNVGGSNTNTLSTVNISELTLEYGARVVLDVNGNGENQHDWLNATTLNIDDTKYNNAIWQNYGPQYIVPILQLNMQTALAVGLYPIGNVNTYNGSLSSIAIECYTMDPDYLSLVHQDGVLYLKVNNEKTTKAASITITGMVPYSNVNTFYPSTTSNDYYMPIVSVTGIKTNGTEPTLSGIFTAHNGVVTNLGTTEATPLFYENFEGSTTPGDYWKNKIDEGKIFSPNYANSEGQCISIQSNNDRGDYTSFIVDYTGINSYQMEFDAYFNNASKTTDFAVMSKSHASSWIYNWGYNWLTTSAYTHNAYLFFMQRGEGSTTFTINDDSNKTVVLNNSTWYHFTLTVNIPAGTVGYKITQKGSTSSLANGIYTLPDGESAECDGIYIRNGRYNYEPGGAGIDNIVITPAVSDMSSFTFTEPGTLKIRSAVNGYASSEETFIVKFPYFKRSDIGILATDYIPVSIHDELATALPTEVANGNAHLYRSGLKEASSWSTMVVPFDLTAEQAKELFGEDVVIGNLIESNVVSVRFETTSGVVHANQPFLIKNVTKDAPYLVMGITSTPVVTPRIITADFDFIGRYTYPEGGTILFNTNDYFFNTSTGLLSTVKENNTAITMKGYRAYFHAPNSQAGAKDISILFDDEPINGIATSINTTDKLGLAGDKQPIYNLQGQRVGSDKNSSQLQSGVYIMNGRKIIVK